MLHSCAERAHVNLDVCRTANSRLTRQPYLAAEVIPSYQFALKSISKLLASYGQTGGETPKAFHTVAAGLFFALLTRIPE